MVMYLYGLTDDDNSKKGRTRENTLLAYMRDRYNRKKHRNIYQTTTAQRMERKNVNKLYEATAKAKTPKKAHTTRRLKRDD